MSLASRTSSVPARRSGALRRCLGDLGVGLLPLLAAAGATWWLLGLPASYLAQALGLYGATAILILRGVSARLDPGGAGAAFVRPSTAPTDALPPDVSGMGVANRITLGRATLALPVGALVFHRGVLVDGGYWWIVLLSTLAMGLDGLDGRVARLTRTATRLGARFDMELDAFLLLALSMLVWQSGKVGAWVLAIGAFRYVFVAAGRIWPALRAPLPQSPRRKTVCVVQGVALLVCLGPIVPAGPAAVAAAGALGLLAYSFAVDVAWLAGSAR